MQRQLEIQKLLDKLSNLKGPQDSLSQKMFCVGFLFHKYHFKDFQDCKMLFEMLSTLDKLIEEDFITYIQKGKMLEQLLLFQSNKKQYTMRVIKEELDVLIDICINDRINGTDYFSKKEMEELNQKYIKELMEKQKLQLKPKESDKESMAYIKKLQEEQQLLLRKKASEASKVQLNIDCPICLQTIQLKDIALLQCSHSFHRQCLSESLKMAIDNRAFPLKCPQCQREVSSYDSAEYLTREYKNKLDNYTFKQFVEVHHQDMSWCPTASCPYVFAFEEGDTEMGCPVCHKVYCLQCKVEFHANMTCKEYQINKKFDKNDEKFLQFVKGAKYKQCPSCKFWVGRTQGCDHMTCRCGFQFCYVCGGVYQNCQCTNPALRPRPPPVPVRPPVRPRKGR